MVFSLWFAAALISNPAFLLSRQRQNAIPAELEEVLSIGSLEDDLLLQWVGVAVDTQGFIYVTDSLDCSVKKFNTRGELVKKSGGRGQGPGEFMAPRLLDSAGGFLYAIDQILPGIQVFDANLNFVGRIPIQEPVSDMKILGSDRIVAAPFVLNGPTRICVYDGEGKNSRVFMDFPESDDMMMDHFSFDCDDRMNFYLVFTFRDRIEKYDSKGTRIWQKDLFGSKEAKMKEVAGYFLPVEVIYKDVTLDGRGNVFVLGGSLSDNPGRDIFVFGSSGRLKTRLTLSDTSHCITIDERGYLYARANEGVTLKKYKIHYRPDSL